MRLLSALGIALLLMAPAQAIELRTVARFIPAKGLISDAALLSTGNVVLAYPEEGYLADYSPQGKLIRHVIREGGLGVPFKPTALIAQQEKGLIVFDEEEHHVFRVAEDGNFSKGIDLGMVSPDAAQLLAAARIGGLSLLGEFLWAMLPDKSLLTQFDLKGKQVSHINLGESLSPTGIYARGQVTSDGTAYVLDYIQGAILYRAVDGAGPFRRVRVADDSRGFEAIPFVQDFAALNDGTLLVATTDPRRPLLLLSKSGASRSARPVSLQLGSATRLSVRASRGSFIVWASDAPVVFVLSPQ